MQIIKEPGMKPIKAWVGSKTAVDSYIDHELDAEVFTHVEVPDIEDAALKQAKNLARLPFIAGEGVALMPDVHMGIGASVGTVIATERALIPSAVGVDIGCGMNAVRLSLKASDLPESLLEIRHQIERDIPLGAGGAHKNAGRELADKLGVGLPILATINMLKDPSVDFIGKAVSQLGTLGSGNHFIELCVDENDDVWVMLHSGSRGVGNMLGQAYIEKAKELCEQWHVQLPDNNLAYLPEASLECQNYIKAVGWAQNYAFKNREVMMETVLAALKRRIPKEFKITQEAINCHHNYVEKEHHFGRNMWITRKGAIRAREGDLGIIPGSMGQRSYIVRGKGNPESYCSCSHGAGRAMSRTEAKKRFSLADLAAQTEGVECRKDDAVLDEIPGAYKRLDVVMDNQRDLIEVVHTLKAVLCVKGN